MVHTVLMRYLGWTWNNNGFDEHVDFNNTKGRHGILLH